MRNLFTAIGFALTFHKNQKYGNEPYFKHLREVDSLVCPYGIEASTLAYLHDVVEDTEATLADIEKYFGARMMNLVNFITDEEGSNRKERKAKTNKKLASLTSEAWNVVLIVKTGDRLANVRNCVKENNKSLFKMYQKEHTEFKKAVYREDVCEELWNELDKLIEEGIE